MPRRFRRRGAGGAASSSAPSSASPPDDAEGGCTPRDAARDPEGCRARRLGLAAFSGGCRWCGGSIAPPRRTFCGAACVHEYRLRSSNRYLRDAVYRRDRGVCAGCGVDTASIGRFIRGAAPGAARDALMREYGVPPRRRVWARKHGGCLFDVDHVRRVADGGGLAGLDNLRTLCIACHKAVTWSANASRTETRKAPRKVKDQTTRRDT